MEDNKVMAEIETLDTPPGRDLRNLLSAGVPIGFRMSGVGNGKVDENNNLVINEIFATNDPA
jgi:hypothetical protein